MSKWLTGIFIALLIIIIGIGIYCILELRGLKHEIDDNIVITTAHGIRLDSVDSSLQELQYSSELP